MTDKNKKQRPIERLKHQPFIFSLFYSLVEGKQFYRLFHVQFTCSDNTGLLVGSGRKEFSKVPSPCPVHLQNFFVQVTSLNA